MCCSIIINTLCCCFTSTTSLASKALSKKTKLSYITLNLLFTSFLTLMTLFGDKIINFFSKFINCPTDSDLTICLGLSLIVRISVSLFLLHFIIIILLFARDSFAKFVNEECFCLKIVFVILLTFIFLFIDNNVFFYYVKFSSYFSVFFLVYQSILLIDFGYVWNETWVAKFETGVTFYGILLILFSLCFATFNGFLIFVNIKNFWIEGCVYNKLNIVFSVIVVFVIICLVLLKFNENSSIMTAFFITCLFTYYNGNSLSSYNSEKCNPFQNNKSTYKDLFYNFFLNLFINLTLGLLTTIFASVSSKSSSTLKNTTNLEIIPRVENEEEENLENFIENEENQNFQNLNKKNANQNLSIYKTNNFIYFHLMMCFFSVYLVMVFFDWKELNLDFDEWTELTSRSSSGFFIKTGNSLGFVVLYLWTLIAPIIFSDRDFN